MGVRTIRRGPSLSKIVPAELRRAAHYAADRAGKAALSDSRAKIQAVGLGRLANVVSYSSSLKKARTGVGNNAWAAIYARRKTSIRGERALLSYARGATIVPLGRKKWLAFATDAIPKRAGRRKMTPALYVSTGLEETYGKLHFVPGRNGRARLVVRPGEQNNVTGRVRVKGKRSSKLFTKRKEITVFILIKFTVRAQRYDQDAIVRNAGRRQGEYVRDYQGGRRT